MEKKVITVLFSRYHTFMANFLHIVSGRGYTHASLSLDEEDEYFYSFNSKGHGDNPFTDRQGSGVLRIS